MQFTEIDETITITVSVSADAISAEQIQQALRDAGYGRYLILQAQLDNLLAEYQQLQQKVIAMTLAANSKELSYPIAQKRAALLSFEIAEDKMKAVAFITAAWGGSPISANALVKAAQDIGIVFGFSKDNIVRLVQEASRAEPGTRLRADIAFGREVQHGKSSHFEALLPEMVARRKQPLVDSEAKVDLRDFGAIPAVSAGDVLMRRLAPTLGEPGFTVTGERTEPSPGTAIDWQLGTGVGFAVNDENLLIAIQDGLPRAIENGATVDEVFTVSQVDLTSGHIVFKGSVVVTGNVIAGMKVIAGGNVFIKGVVEGSLIEAGGDITIGGAIIGHQLAAGEEQEYSTKISAQGDIFCNMAQYTELECKGNIYATKYLMHCAVDAHSVLVGTEEKINGKIVGGYYQLAQNLSCGQLGSPSNGVVVVKLNRQLNPIIEQQLLLRAQVTEAKALMDELKEQIDSQKKLLAGQADPQLVMFEQEFIAQRQLGMKLLEELRELEAQRQQILQTLEVKVTQQLFAAVEVHFANESVRSRREYGPSSIKVLEGHPAISPL